MHSRNIKSENEDESEKSAAHRQAVRPGDKQKHAKKLMQLKQQQKTIEKSLSSFIDRVKVDSLIIQSVSLDNMNISIKREQVFESLVNNVRDVVGELKAAQSIVSNLTEIQRLDVNEYKKKLVNLSHAIQNLKNSLSPETLSDEQIVLDKELKDFLIQFERYTSLKHNEIHIAPLSTCTTDTIRRKEIPTYKEMNDFHKLLAKTGHTENWTDEDHALFLRTRRKCKALPALVGAIQTKCPDLSAETIINHEAWYKKYLNLRKNQRQKVNEWQSQRKAEKSKENRSESGDRLEVTAGVHSANGESSYRLKSNSGMKKALMIERWRTERINKRSADDEQVKYHLESRRVIEEKRRQTRQKEVQEILHEYKAKKHSSIMSAESKRQENCNDKSKRDDALILAFRQQDRDYVKRKVELILRARRSGHAFSSTFIRRKSIKLRSSTTLFNVTKVWSEKCKRNFSPKSMNFEGSLYIKDIPKNCTRWRNEESVDLNA